MTALITSTCVTYVESAGKKDNNKSVKQTERMGQLRATECGELKIHINWSVFYKYAANVCLLNRCVLLYKAALCSTACFDGHMGTQRGGSVSASPKKCVQKKKKK